MRKYRMSKLAAATFVLIVIFCSSLTIDDLFTEDAEAVRPISISLSFEGDQPNSKGNLVEIPSGPDKTGAARITGKIHMFKTARVLRERIFIYLRLESDRPDIVIGSVFPQIITFDPIAKFSNNATFDVNLRLTMPMVNYSTGINPPVKVQIVGEWSTQLTKGVETWDGGTIDPYPLFVNIKPYQYLQMNFDPVLLQLGPGQSGWVTCTVENQGNGWERVDLTMPGESVYARSGWIFEFQETTLFMGPRSKASTKIKVTAPREFEPKFHMEMHDFSVLATSYISKYQEHDGTRDDIHTYEMGFMVYVLGVDFVFVPWVWAIVLYIALALVMLNLGVNIITMKRRKLPRGKEPGFIALYHHISNPEKRARNRERRKRKRELKSRVREAKRARKQKENTALGEAERSKAPPLPSSGTGKRARDKKGEKPTGLLKPPSKGSPQVLDMRKVEKEDDFDIELEAPKRKSRGKRKGKLSLPFGKGPKRGGSSKDVDSELKDVLSELDD